MSTMYIPNYTDGQTVNQNALNFMFQEVQQRTSFLDYIVPCVYYGLNGTVTGLDATISLGEGRTKDVTLSTIGGGETLQIRCKTNDTTISIPPNSTGYIVVNSNMVPGSDIYNYVTNDTVEFVTTLTPSFPIGTLVGQIPLYTVTSNATNATLTDTNLVRLNNAITPNHMTTISADLSTMYTYLASGHIIQAVKKKAPPGGNTLPITFPFAFPNQLLSISAIVASNLYVSYLPDSITNSSINLLCNGASFPANEFVFVTMIGY